MPSTAELVQTVPPALVEGAFAVARAPLSLAARVTGGRTDAPLRAFDRVQAEVEVRLGEVLHVELLAELGRARRVQLDELEILEERRDELEAERLEETAKAAQREAEFARQARIHSQKAATRPADSPVNDEDAPKAAKQRKAARRDAIAKLAELSHEEAEIDATLHAINAGPAPEA